jgi:hypothetical protein
MKHWHKWTKAEDKFLKENYEWIGDKHLAAMFQKRFPKHYPWTLKHIEKRRSYLGLNRTHEQIHILRYINNQDGRQLKMWDKRNRMKDGEIRTWNKQTYIKHNGKVILYHRFLAGAKKGQVVRRHEGGVRIVTLSDNARLNAKIRAALPDDLKQTIKALNKLKKLIYGKENKRSARNTV